MAKDNLLDLVAGHPDFKYGLAYYALHVPTKLLLDKTDPVATIMTWMVETKFIHLPSPHFVAFSLFLEK